MFATKVIAKQAINTWATASFDTEMREKCIENCLSAKVCASTHAHEYTYADYSN